MIGLGEALLQFSPSPSDLEQFGIATGTNIFSFMNDAEGSLIKETNYILHIMD